MADSDTSDSGQASAVNRPRKPVKHSGFTCSAAGCTSCHGKGCTLHKFPKDPGTRRQWIQFVQTCRANFGPAFGTPTAYSRLCKLHFSPDCYPPNIAIAKSFGLASNKRPQLLPKSVPTIQTPSPSSARSHTMKNRTTTTTARTTTTKRRSRTIEGCCTVTTAVKRPICTTTSGSDLTMVVSKIGGAFVKRERQRDQLANSELMSRKGVETPRIPARCEAEVHMETEVKSEVETDTEVAGDGMEVEEPTGKSEVETDTEVAGDGMEKEDPAVKSETEVKIEIDVAEDPSLYWGMVAEQHTHESSKDIWPFTSETVSIHMKPTSPSPAELSTDCRVWFKQETANQSTDCCVKLKQEVADQSNDNQLWLKQEAAGQSNDSQMWLKQEAADQSTEPLGVNPDSEPNSGEDSRISHPADNKKQTGVDCSTPSATVTRGVHVSQQLIHTGEKTHVCQQCDVTFKYLCGFKRHMLIHTGEKPHKCSECSAAFKLLSHLKQHMQIHSGEKPYKCSQCSAAFTRSSDLKQHMLIHSGVKPHKCSQCSASFAQSSTLNTHMVIHTGVKPHKCSQCSAAFARSSTLNTHMVIHTRVKPHKCSQCSAAFTRSSDLKKHMVIHTLQE